MKLKADSSISKIQQLTKYPCSFWLFSGLWLSGISFIAFIWHLGSTGLGTSK